MSVRVTMIGTGYVGLVTGACFADLGHDVICVDKDERKIEMIGNGKLPIYEPGLDELVQRNVEAGRLRFSTDVANSVKGREAVFIAVGTPSEKGTGRADLKYVFGAATEIAQHIDGLTVIVTKSTVPVGTNRRVHQKMSEVLGDDKLFAVASNPEFLREGAAIHDFMQPDRIVIGFEDKRSRDVMGRVYAPLTGREVPLVETNIETAETIKYAANAFLAIKVSFINEVSDLCEVIGADVRQVARGIGLDKRIGQTFLGTGPGWGGSCFPKDTRALLSTAKDVGMPCKIVEAAILANTNRKATMIARVKQLLGDKLAGKRIGVLGVTFKGQTDDMRESPSLDILPPLVEAGATVTAFDPSNPHEAPLLLPSVGMAGSAADALKDADLVIVMTEWMIFKSYDLKKLASAMHQPRMLDLRNLFDRDDVLAAGFTEYHGLGFGGIDERPSADEIVRRASVSG